MTEGILIALGAPVAILALWVFLCAPARGRKRARAWSGTPFAHRGLYGDSRPENSLKAFERACEMGCGIELDVQSTKDGRLVVFHDDGALRMAGDERRICDMTFAQVRRLILPDEESRVPTFDEVLETVAGRAPMLVEIKSAPDIGELTRGTVERLRRYQGAYVVESFNPLSLNWLKKHAPEIIRGQLIQGYRDYRKNMRPVASFLLSCAITNALSRPDFIAYSHEMKRSPAIWLLRNVFHTPLASWTISDADEMKILRGRGEMPIFEHIPPTEWK